MSSLSSTPALNSCRIMNLDELSSHLQQITTHCILWWLLHDRRTGIYYGV
jgi:hypothetical protein